MVCLGGGTVATFAEKKSSSVLGRIASKKQGKQKRKKDFGFWNFCFLCSDEDVDYISSSEEDDAPDAKAKVRKKKTKNKMNNSPFEKR